MAADSRGYYARLGLSPGASIGVVRAVYRQLALECHPDRPGVGDGGERFRHITEAYDALSDAAFKASYDQEIGSGEADRTSAQHRRAAQVDPVLCQVCGKVTAQPRRLAFWRITSFVLGSQKSPVQRIYCSGCAGTEQWKSTVWTSLLGWWGVPWGPAWSIMHGVTNASGGTRQREVDEALMWQNAVAFATRGEGALAVGLSNVLRKSDDAEIGQKSVEIIRFFANQGIDPTTTLKDVWNRSFLRTTALFVTAFAVPIAALTLILLPSELGLTKVSSAFGSDGTTDGLFDETFGPVPDQASIVTAQAPAVSEPEVSSAHEPELVCEAPPSNGELLVDRRAAAGSGHKLDIDNGTAGDAIIKVRSMSDDAVLASFFVSRGESATLENIPDGEYKIQYAIGDKLAVDCRTFIDDGNTSANEFPGVESLVTRYEERFDGTTVIRGHLSYTLYSVPGGNVRPSGIRMDEFNKP